MPERFCVMKLGIKYCGGCNPRYSRQQEVEKLIRQLESEPVVVTYETDQVCDVWLVVHGCMASCGKQDHLKARWERLEANQGKDFVRIQRRLKELLDIERESVSSKRQEEKRIGSGHPLKKPDWTAGGKRILRIGQRSAMIRKFSGETVAAFANLTGDFNGIHVKGDVAEKSLYRQPVVHGMLTASLLSTVMGMQLPGDGTVFQDFEVSFLLPVYLEDEIRAEVVLVSCEEHPNHYVGYLKGTCTNQDGLVVLRANAKQVMPKRYFVVER